ncbi:small ribosomal subunit biogenesis GTPase RsgA [Alteromonas sp. a30]|uniref:small ribosomal subunit biogenesis GTPase RsgA n=1 Tax=Alteromonas sp. a30 TaxID=2730917 RepID=UPI0022804FC0|nr:small ribosomal subunit biogenesis GTPase RsgA [Alteromonas sp. a30]MCY7295365.1 small ribosomal subunit biogenesis GTPase RsgA [Alteromonas sp. a30]
MAKRNKLTHRQKRQVGKNLRKRAQATEDLPEDGALLKELSGIVVGRFGQHADIEDSEGLVYRCHIRRTIDSLVCGDEVLFRPTKDESSSIKGVVEAVQPRRSILTRPDFYDGIKPVAANIDQIIIVSSLLPALSLNIIDRYLVASEDVNITPVILLNKIDLADEEHLPLIEEAMQTYHDIGYDVIFASCKTQEGLTALQNQLVDKTSIFVGQSGVGKSSLINQLLPDVEEATGKVSENSGLGQHTTTAAKLLHFPLGGQVIDSPGVREFALWHLDDEKVTWGFKEFRDYIGGCKYRDCKHKDDPGCAIREAVEEGKIDASRYDSYHRILESMDEQRPSYSISKRKL